MAEQNKEAKKENKKEHKQPQKSAHGFYYYLKKAFRNPSHEMIESQRKNSIAYRAGERITKLEKPTRLDRAHSLGYKAKKGFVVFRVVIQRGGHYKPRPTTKRRSKRFNIKKILHMNYQWIAERRVQNAYRNLEVLNSYKIGKDGRFYFFEVICIDPQEGEIKNDKNFKWLQNPANRFRVFRGRTSSGRKARGLRNKSPNLKIRPSARAWGRRGR
jgi:large subunit ribosomal protein L15e